MTLNNRIHAFVQLGNYLKNNLHSEELQEIIHLAYVKNKWFEKENIQKAIEGIVFMLDENKMVEWLSNYKIENTSPKNVGIVMAGNIPMVGFHDLLTVLISGNKAKVKFSSSDTVLMQFLADKLIAINPEFSDFIEIKDRLTEIDLVIATGSDNTAKQFEYYFSKIPRIIRRNRTSVAVLSGHETTAELKQLGNDIFMYFGLGCRNVTKLYVPENYVFDFLFESIIDFANVLYNNKYVNNYEYNRAIYLLGNETFLDNNFVMIRESENLFSPVGVIHFEYYKDLSELNKKLETNKESIQCIVSNATLGIKTIPFGKSQMPEVWDYADGVDTMDFLMKV
jgi:hypothetical protein